MSTRTTPRRGRRDAEETRRKLLRAGRRAFARKGLAGVNLRDDVLARAGVSVGSFYHQFDDKTGLLLAVLADAAERLEPGRAALFEAPPARTTAELVDGFYRTLLDWAGRNREAWKVGARERFSDQPRLRRFLAAQRERWVRDLADAQRHLPGPRTSSAERIARAELIVRLAFAAADEQVLAGSRRGGRDRQARAPLLRFTLSGLRGLRGPRPARPAGG